MRIQEPRPQLSKNDKAIICLLADLLIQQFDHNDANNGNLSDQHIIISEENASELLRLINILLDSREFHERVLFVESIGFSHSDDDRWKKIFFKKSDRIPVQTTQKWLAFRKRLGHSVSTMPYTQNVEYMQFDHFMKMEGMLFENIGLDPRVSSVLLKTVKMMEDEVERRRRQDCGPIKFISGVIVPLKKLLDDKKVVRGGIALSGTKIAGLATLVSNCSILFTTRDWGVAGTISTMASGLAVMAGE